MKIIFNADDFGYSKGINYGIFECCKNGVVRSATVMANMPDFANGVELAKALPSLKIGVHFNISGGKSLGTGYRTITNESGEFFNHAFLHENIENLDLSEIENEFNLQIEKVQQAGISPSHFDGHHHLHSAGGVLEITLSLAKKHNVPVRLGNETSVPREFSGVKRVPLVTSFFGENATLSHMEKILQVCTADTEIMCHPGFNDTFLQSTSGYNVQRVTEMEFLTSPALAALLEKYGHSPASFCEI
jgi:predicted glycoside hydrolase/deacetylase ChbG (UPF0249 family)